MESREDAGTFPAPADDVDVEGPRRAGRRFQHGGDDRSSREGVEPDCRPDPKSLPDVFLRENHRRRAQGKNPVVVEEDEPVAEVGRVVEVVEDPDDGYPPGEIADRLEDADLVAEVEVGRKMKSKVGH